jgi:cell division septation protein DedD
VKLIKSIGTFLRSKLSHRKKRSAPQPPREDRTDAPKNGRLVVAVGASVLAMIVLGVINIRLIRNPSIADKAFRPIFSSKAESASKSHGTSVEDAAAKTCQSRTEITFWRNLKSQDEDPVRVGGAPVRTASETPPVTEQQSNRADKTDVKKELPKQGRPGAAPGSEGQHLSDPMVAQPASGEKTYRVQVGAFTNPAIAQEWAQKWKARGYDVALKPVARPNTGIIYRLYLGNFTSEKQADDLVKHLKSKEGINALRLLVRDWGGASH